MSKANSYVSSISRWIRHHFEQRDDRKKTSNVEGELKSQFQVIFQYIFYFLRKKIGRPCQHILQRYLFMQHIKCIKCPLATAQKNVSRKKGIFSLSNRFISLYTSIAMKIQFNFCSMLLKSAICIYFGKWKYNLNLLLS